MLTVFEADPPTVRTTAELPFCRAIFKRVDALGLRLADATF